MPPARSGQIESLQIGRGIAALLVVLHHATSLVSINAGATFAGGFFHAGFAGVDFFFVLSGFIIFHRHAREFGQREKVAEYAWRRLTRVFPVYWIVTAAVLATAIAVPGYGGADITNPAVLIHSFLLLPMNPGPLLFVGWTLTHELWFYLIFAGLIAAKGRWMKMLVALWIAAMVAMLCIPASGELFANAWFRVAFMPLNLEFVMGCAAAWLVRRTGGMPAGVWKWMIAAGAAGFTLLALAAARIPVEDLQVRIPGFGLSAFLIVLGMAGDKLHGKATGEGSTGLFHGALVFLGNASYSLYLVHTLALSIAWKLGEIAGVLPKIGPQGLAWICISASVVAGCLFHLIVERPLLRRSKWRHGDRLELSKR